MKAPRYRRLTQVDRCHISSYLEMNLSQAEIARKINKSRATISRELRRNESWGYRYYAITAHDMARKRRAHCHRKFSVSEAVEGIVIHHLLKEWSPERIAGRFAVEGLKGPCKQSIYNYINNRSPGLTAALKRFNKRGAGRHRLRKKYVCRPGRLSIHHRPKGAKDRTQFGHWERDGMMVAGQKQLLVCVERKSRFTRIEKIHQVNGPEIDRLTIELTKTSQHKVRSVTNDNGSYFKPNQKLPFPVYFCDPHKPQQRGTVENTIGLIRRNIKRNANFHAIDESTIRELEEKLNHMPRKVLGFKTPYEVFFERRVALFVGL